MRTRDKKLTRQIVVRVDDHIYGALLEDAECSGRTVAQSVRFMLRSELDGVLCARCGRDVQASLRRYDP